MACLREKGFYKTKARIFRDSNIECTLRWFRVPDGTPFLPTAHLWAGRPWRYDHTPPTEGPGELLQSRLVWDKGLPPLRPTNWIGADDWWEQGVPFSALGGPAPRVRPGVCASALRSACATGCDQDSLMSPLFTMDDFEIKGLTSSVLVKEEGCVFSTQCYSGCDQANEGTAKAWWIDPLEDVKGLTACAAIAVNGCVFSSCCSNS